MTENKWNIGSINVQGQAMFGDDNQMQVVVSKQDLAGLNVGDQAAVGAALARLEQAVATPAMPAGDVAELKEMLGQILAELKKPRESQSPGILRQCLDRLLEAARSAPPLVTTAIELKGLLGL